MVATPPWDTSKWLLIPVVTFPFLALVLRHWGWAPSASDGDYAHYLLHARAIVEGRPYGDTGYIYQSTAGLIGPPSLPPGLPLMLAPLIALGGTHSPLVRLLMVAFLAAFALLAAWRLAREVPPWQAALGAAFAAFAIESSLASVSPISDPGFAFLLWATIVAVDRHGTWSWWRVLGVTALGFAAIAYRLAGLALLPALLLFALSQRRRLGLRPLVPAMLWGASAAILLLSGRATIPFTERVPRTGDAVAEHLGTFLDQYLSALSEAALSPLAGRLPNYAYHAVAAGLMLLGAVLILWRARGSFLVCIVATYALLLFVAPVAEPRYAWPFYPLLGAGLAVGLTTVARRALASWTEQRRTALVGVTLAVVLLLALARQIQRPAPPSLVRHPDARALFDWLAGQRRGAADSMRLAFHNPRVVALETRIPAMGIVPRTAEGQMRALATARATHLIWQGTGLGSAGNPGRAPCVQRVANRLPELYPDRFALQYRNASFRVYRVLPASRSQYGPGLPIAWNRC